MPATREERAPRCGVNECRPRPQDVREDEGGWRRDGAQIQAVSQPARCVVEEW
jgi:hypothetical protein